MRFIDIKSFVVGALLGTLIVMAMLWAAAAKAETQVVYNTARLGEGAVIQESGNQVAFILFTHWDDQVYVRPPVVSPAPPPLPVLIDKHNFWLIGTSHNFDGEVGSGNVYFDVQHDRFPVSKATDDPNRRDVSKQHKVGTFLIEKDSSGEDDEWWLILETNGTLHNKTAFYSIFHFDTPLRD